MGVRSVTKELVKVTGDAKFILVELGDEGPKPVYDEDGQLLRFTDGAAAAKSAVRWSEKVGRKVQPRRVNNDDWREREAKRLGGEYAQLPWSRERWWLDMKHVWGDHYPHASLEKGAMLAFTESEEKGAADIQTRIKPGRYLERFFGERKLLNQYVIRDLCAAFSAKYEDNMLLLAETEDEIEEIYTTGPSSCMSHGVGSYNSGSIHPARVYASPDLKVAYMKREGRTVARVVVFPEKKWYSAIYGDAARLRPLLEKQGYRNNPPYGARLLRKEVGKNKEGLFSFVVPHIDSVLWVTDEGDYLRVGTGPRKDNVGILAEGAKGVSEVVGYKCTRCEAAGGKGVLSQRQVIQVFVSEKQTRNWCKTCGDTHAFTDPISGYRVDKDQGVPVSSGNQPMVWGRYVEKNCFKCPYDGLLYWVKDAVLMADGTKISPARYKALKGKLCGNGCGRGTTADIKCEPKCGANRTTAYTSTTFGTATSRTVW